MTDLDQIVAAVRASAKYRTVAPSFVRTLAASELARGRDWDAALKATKKKLHQVGGVYRAGRHDWDGWLAALRAASAAADTEALHHACLTIMRHHASTRERLPMLAEFYRAIFALLPPVTSILDLACGLNPLALPWMPLSPGTDYLAYDIYEDLVAFLAAALPLFPVTGRAEVRDVIGAPPDRPADVALVLKTLPCLEQVDRAASGSLLSALRARYLVVSFPGQSLGGRKRGMLAHYESHFRTLIAEQGWPYERLVFGNELVFVVHKER